MIRVLALALTVAALVLLLFPSARAGLRRRLPQLIIYGSLAVLLLLVFTGRAHWLFALGGGLLAFGQRLLRWAGLLPWVMRLWRGWRGGGASRTAAGTGAMAVTEARETLGVGPDADRDEILAAHRRLVQRVHPDRGGSAALTRRLNEARDVLLTTLS